LRVGRYFGIVLILNPFFLLLLMVLSLLGLFPQALIAFGTVFLHELAHVISAKGHGLNVSSVELLPIGGVAVIDDLIEVDPDVEKSVAIAGPLTNGFLLVLAAVLYLNQLAEIYWLRYFVYVNVMLVLFNLLPGLPLDGGRIYRAYLSRKIGYRKATVHAAKIGKVLGVILVLGGLVGVWFKYLSPAPVVLGFFIYLAACKEAAMSMYVLMRYLTRKKEELQKEGCLYVQHLIARHDTPIKDVLKRFIPKKFHIVMILEQDDSLRQFVTEKEIIDTMFEHGIEVCVMEALNSQRD
jgi:stage IV sporulation protein FB